VDGLYMSQDFIIMSFWVLLALLTSLAWWPSNRTLIAKYKGDDDAC
jgi:cyanate permease